MLRNLAWRRSAGAILMILGAACVVAMIALATIVIARSVERGGSIESFGALSIVTLPGLIGGLLVLLLGRWVYGNWTETAPVTNVSAQAVSVAGFLIAAGFGGMLLFLFATGVEDHDLIAAVILAFGAAGGVAVMVLGNRIAVGSGRRYLD